MAAEPAGASASPRGSRPLWWGLGACLLAVGVLVWWFWRPHVEVPLPGTVIRDPDVLQGALQGPELVAADSEALRQTVIVPTLDTPIPPGKSAVWCSSFQLAWNRLKTDFAGGPLLIEGAEVVARRLNEAEQSEDDLVPGSYYVAAGKVKDGIQRQIEAEFKTRFPGAQLPSACRRTK